MNAITCHPGSPAFFAVTSLIPLAVLIDPFLLQCCLCNHVDSIIMLGPLARTESRGPAKFGYICLKEVFAPLFLPSSFSILKLLSVCKSA